MHKPLRIAALIALFSFAAFGQDVVRAPDDDVVKITTSLIQVDVTVTDKDGNLVFYTAHTYSQGIMETVNEQRHVSYHSLRQIPKALEDAGRRCVRAFDVRERFFHLEFFRTAPETFVALEVNMRPPGGYTTDMFNYANDIDIYSIWAELLAHGRSALEYKRLYHCCYASRKHRQNCCAYYRKRSLSASAVNAC